ncbi:ABC transporter ATP-binding protein [Shewanella sp. JM162201]|uniref:ABC transporter ATP-binding protein n=1 Tax=Shewanella jiangmenensis TaxID=2837387 RepID=A0ABS5V4H5_9GAMM|nr:ABC transporter ATP-binding protein [Shewanella jiangmenensis]MBT1444833.1 ABC transporter ATP-binding protein [Shewanella jiangmenensis]
MSAVSFRDVSRVYDSVRAVDRVSFNIPEGEFFTLLGPSGSGKTTCLRMIAGFEFASSGSIAIHGQDVSATPPFARNVNTVFQDYALFPHMNVRDNIAYGLMVAGVPKAARHREAEAMLELVQLPGVGDRKPSQLSGGQRQRIAIARALINKPKILLLDEPLGALDLKLREQMQVELKRLQRQVGITFVFVTHDQQEALSMSDRICIFNRGRIEQIGSPDEIYETPKTEFVARFVGNVNLFEQGALPGLMSTERGLIMLRPERISISAGHTSERPQKIAGTVQDSEYLGAFIRYLVRAQNGLDITVHQPNLGHSQHAPRFTPGTTVGLGWDDSALHSIKTTKPIAEGGAG